MQNECCSPSSGQGPAFEFNAATASALFGGDCVLPLTSSTPHSSGHGSAFTPILNRLSPHHMFGGGRRSNAALITTQTVTVTNSGVSEKDASSLAAAAKEETTAAILYASSPSLGIVSMTMHIALFRIRQTVEVAAQSLGSSSDGRGGEDGDGRRGGEWSRHDSVQNAVDEGINNQIARVHALLNLLIDVELMRKANRHHHAVGASCRVGASGGGAEMAGFTTESDAPSNSETNATSSSYYYHPQSRLAAPAAVSSGIVGDCAALAAGGGRSLTNNVAAVGSNSVRSDHDVADCRGDVASSSDPSPSSVGGGGGVNGRSARTGDTSRQQQQSFEPPSSKVIPTAAPPTTISIASLPPSEQSITPLIPFIISCAYECPVDAIRRVYRAVVGRLRTELGMVMPKESDSIRAFSNSDLANVAGSGGGNGGGSSIPSSSSAPPLWFVAFDSRNLSDEALVAQITQPPPSSTSTTQSSPPTEAQLMTMTPSASVKLINTLVSRGRYFVENGELPSFVSTLFSHWPDLLEAHEATCFKLLFAEEEGPLILFDRLLCALIAAAVHGAEGLARSICAVMLRNGSAQRVSIGGGGGGGPMGGVVGLSPPPLSSSSGGITAAGGGTGLVSPPSNAPLSSAATVSASAVNSSSAAAAVTADNAAGVAGTSSSNQQQQKPIRGGATIRDDTIKLLLSSASPSSWPLKYSAARRVCAILAKRPWTLRRREDIEEGLLQYWSEPEVIHMISIFSYFLGISSLSKVLNVRSDYSTSYEVAMLLAHQERREKQQQQAARSSASASCSSSSSCTSSSSSPDDSDSDSDSSSSSSSMDSRRRKHNKSSAAACAGANNYVNVGDSTAWLSEKPLLCALINGDSNADIVYHKRITKSGAGGGGGGGGGAGGGAGAGGGGPVAGSSTLTTAMFSFEDGVKSMLDTFFPTSAEDLTDEFSVFSNILRQRSSASALLGGGGAENNINGGGAGNDDDEEDKEEAMATTVKIYVSPALKYVPVSIPKNNNSSPSPPPSSSSNVVRANANNNNTSDNDLASLENTNTCAAMAAPPPSSSSAIATATTTATTTAVVVTPRQPQQQQQELKLLDVPDPIFWEAVRSYSMNVAGVVDLSYNYCDINFNVGKFAKAFALAATMQPESDPSLPPYGDPLIVPGNNNSTHNSSDQGTATKNSDDNDRSACRSKYSSLLPQSRRVHEEECLLAVGLCAMYAKIEALLVRGLSEVK